MCVYIYKYMPPRCVCTLERSTSSRLIRVQNRQKHTYSHHLRAQANLVWASIEETSPVRGAENLLVMQLRFNGEIGNMENGVWITVTGAYV